MKKILYKMIASITIIGIILSLFMNYNYINAKDKYDGIDKIYYDKKGMPIYSMLTMGKYDGEPIKWRILDVNKKTGEAFLLAEDMIMTKEFDNKGKNTWENYSLRKYLNNEFYKETFTTTEKKAILTSTIKTEEYEKIVDEGVMDRKKVYNKTKDKIYLPSKEELRNESYGFIWDLECYDYARKITKKGNEMLNWLRDTFNYATYNDLLGELSKEEWKVKQSERAIPDIINTEYGIIQNGFIHSNEKLGIRPEMKVNLNKLNLTKILKKSKPQSNADKRIVDMFISKDLMVIKKGESISIGCSDSSKIRVGMSPNISSNNKFNISTSNSKIVSINKKSSNLYNVKANKAGSVNLRIKSETKNKAGLNLTKDITLIVEDLYNNNIDEIKNVTYDANKKAIYSMVNYGTWEGKPLEWRVLDIDKEKGTAFLMTERVVDREQHQFGERENESTNWLRSRINDWLNNDNLIYDEVFYNGFYRKAFTETEKEGIVKTKHNMEVKIEVDATDKTYDEIFSDDKIIADQPTKDKVYLLNKSDILNEKYGFKNELITKKGMIIEERYNKNKYYINSYERKCYKSDPAKIAKDMEGNASGWWLLSQNVILQGGIEDEFVGPCNWIYVNEKGQVMLDGKTGCGGYSIFEGIRPVMNVKLSALKGNDNYAKNK